MPNYHIYITSSLPYLQFGLKAPISFERFLELCRNLLSPEEFSFLKISKNIIEEDIKHYSKISDTAIIWQNFEFMLRNELVKIRAKRLHRNALSYLRGHLETEPSLAHKISEIVRQPHPLEAERMLDMVRWNKLEELCFGHYFDIEFLFIYAQKLLLLERWDKIHSADKQELLNNTLNAIENVTVNR